MRTQIIGRMPGIIVETMTAPRPDCGAALALKKKGRPKAPFQYEIMTGAYCAQNSTKA